MMRDGVINIDKPAGWTSHDVVAKLRGVLRVKKVGHAGTLDPDATGVLLICFGKGTKIVPFLMDGEKEYEAVLRLGEETDTEDASGTVLRRCEVPAEVIGRAQAVLESFVGTYEQIPPMYSAVKVKGIPLYRSARAGKSVVRTARPVTIREIRFQKNEGPDIFFSVVCSKGTYIRTLCVDIGTKLGVGGHLLRLRRTRSGSFRIGDAVALNRFVDLHAEGSWAKSAYSLNDVLADFPAVSIRERNREKIVHGAPCGAEGVLKFDPFRKGESIRLLDSEGTLLAIGLAVVSSEEVKSKESFFKIETVLSDLSAEPSKAGAAAKESIVESPLY